MRSIKLSLAEWETEPPAGFGDITRPELTRPLSIVVGMRALQSLSGWGFVIFNLSPMFQAVGVSNPDAAATMVMAAQVPVALIESALLDVGGRRLLLISSASVMACFAALLAVAYSLPASSAAKDPLAIGGALGFLTAYSAGVGPIPCVLLGELLPNRYRVPAAAAVIVVSNTLAFSATITYGVFIEAVGEGVFFAVACCVAIAIAAFMFCCIPETRGRSLEEVAVLLARPGHAWVDAPMKLGAPPPPPSRKPPIRHVTEEDLESLISESAKAQ